MEKRCRNGTSWCPHRSRRSSHSSLFLHFLHVLHISVLLCFFLCITDLVVGPATVASSSLTDSEDAISSEDVARSASEAKLHKDDVVRRLVSESLAGSTSFSFDACENGKAIDCVTRDELLLMDRNPPTVHAVDANDHVSLMAGSPLQVEDEHEDVILHANPMSDGNLRLDDTHFSRQDNPLSSQDVDVSLSLSIDSRAASFSPFDAGMVTAENSECESPELSTLHHEGEKEDDEIFVSFSSSELVHSELTSEAVASLELGADTQPVEFNDPIHSTPTIELASDSEVRVESSKSIEATRDALYNYASSAVGAKILSFDAPSKPKGVWNILDNHPDSYLHFDCRETPISVDIELSEEVLLREIVLINHEFFSSSVSRFQILGSQKYPCHHKNRVAKIAQDSNSNVDTETDQLTIQHSEDKKSYECQWKVLGEYTASDTRNSPQEFFISEPSWIRFLRFFWLSNHGSEHYCTLSSLRAHGSNMIDDLKSVLQPDQARATPLSSPTQDSLSQVASDRSTSTISESNSSEVSDSSLDSPTLSSSSSMPSNSPPLVSTKTLPSSFSRNSSVLQLIRGRVDRLENEYSTLRQLVASMDALVDALYARQSSFEREVRTSLSSLRSSVSQLRSQYEWSFTGWTRSFSSNGDGLRHIHPEFVEDGKTPRILTNTWLSSFRDLMSFIVSSTWSSLVGLITLTSLYLVISYVLKIFSLIYGCGRSDLCNCHSWDWKKVFLPGRERFEAESAEREIEIAVLPRSVTFPSLYVSSESNENSRNQVENKGSKKLQTSKMLRCVRGIQHVKTSTNVSRRSDGLMGSSQYSEDIVIESGDQPQDRFAQQSKNDPWEISSRFVHSMDSSGNLHHPSLQQSRAQSIGEGEQHTFSQDYSDMTQENRAFSASSETANSKRRKHRPRQQSQEGFQDDPRHQQSDGEKRRVSIKGARQPNLLTSGELHGSRKVLNRTLSFSSFRLNNDGSLLLPEEANAKSNISSTHSFRGSSSTSDLVGLAQAKRRISGS